MPYPPPTVTNVSCGQQALRPTFDVTWDTSNYPSGQQYVIGIFDTSLTNPIAVSDPVLGSFGSVTATQDVLQSNAYQIRVTTYENGTTGVWPASGPPALFISPTNLTIAFDGTTLGAQWQNPAAGTMPLEGRITIGIGMSQYVFDLPGTQGAFVPNGVPLDPQQQAVLTVSGLYGESLGPPSVAVPLIQKGYPLGLVDNGGGNPRKIVVQGFVSGQKRTFNVLVSSGGTPLQWFNDVQEDSNGQISLTFGAEPVPGVLYEISARLTMSNSTGPLGPRVPLVAAAPEILLLTYTAAASNAILSFEALLPKGHPFVSGMQITVVQNDSRALVVQQIVANGSGMLQIAKLATDRNYTASFRSAIGIPYGVSLGPAASTSPAVLTTTSSIAAINYDGSVLEAEYSSSTQHGVTAYQLEILSGTSAIASAQFSGTKGWIPLQGYRGALYNVQVRTVGYRTIGPAGQTASAVIGSVVINSATTDPITSKTTLRWTAVANATSYSLLLFANNIPAGPPTTGLTGTSYTLPNAIAAVANLSAALAAVVADGGTIATGPFGTPYALPTAQPSNVSVDYNGASLTVSWTPTAAATGYTASVFATGGVLPIASADVLANATSVTFPPFTVDPASTYRVVVQAKVNTDSGPPRSAFRCSPQGSSSAAKATKRRTFASQALSHSRTKPLLSTCPISGRGRRFKTCRSRLAWAAFFASSSVRTPTLGQVRIIPTFSRSLPRVLRGRSTRIRSAHSCRVTTPRS